MLVSSSDVLSSSRKDHIYESNAQEHHHKALITSGKLRDSEFGASQKENMVESMDA